MKAETTTWTISELHKNIDTINPAPQYQRAPVWRLEKKKLLIDSILNGYDLPKFYFRHTPQNPTYKYEVADGQQRLNSIVEFVNDRVKLDVVEIEGIEHKNLYYSDLTREQKAKLLSYKLSVSIVEEATSSEIRTLFARLQMGVNLIPVELRHALASNLGFMIQSVVETHTFFKNSRILESRYKHQDYLDHAVCLVFYGETKPLNAASLKSLYTNFADIDANECMPEFAKIQKVLLWMDQINAHAKGVFKNKWTFVDMFYMLFLNHDRIKKVKASNIAQKLLSFEVRRKKYNKNPKELLESPNTFNEYTFEYINAFNRDGGDKSNFMTRNKVFSYMLNNFNYFEYN
ncbi:DUF262 domain-containing protein [Hymenobacter latericus]|uniref:DUF262 domain-containing protein n=1 Tax=Hymenobacter sp. YIM 151858-1 TaxID=2987688 RepID=UPI002227706F|nr:DUF262 domain-containing protein [Hymenobacter sp. YIM 151858-1]UYZ61186.1 DUF262 domain-containing protein [Hymenobacter sp. YIM 151858-1]